MERSIHIYCCVMVGTKSYYLRKHFSNTDYHYYFASGRVCIKHINFQTTLEQVTLENETFCATELRKISLKCKTVLCIFVLGYQDHGDIKWVK